MKEKLKKVFSSTLFVDLLYIITGTFITAFSIDSILKPNGLITSGVTGIAIIIEKYTGVNYSIICYGFIFLILIFAFILMGKKEVLRILFLSVLYPTVLLILQQFKFKFIQGDLILASIYFSIFYGVGLGMVLKRGYSMGGTDTIARMLHKRLLPFVNVSQLLLVLDGLTILAGAFVFGKDIALYSIINQMVAMKVVDFVMFGFGSKLYKLEIISTKYEEVREYVMHTLNRGVTLYNIKGGYTNEDKMQLVTVCSPRESVLIKQFMKSIDPVAFVEILPIVSVWGIGSRFTNISKEE